jgi:hypothetical protein
MNHYIVYVYPKNVYADIYREVVKAENPLDAIFALMNSNETARELAKESIRIEAIRASAME